MMEEGHAKVVVVHVRWKWVMLLPCTMSDSFSLASDNVVNTVFHNVLSAFFILFSSVFTLQFFLWYLRTENEQQFDTCN